MVEGKTVRRILPKNQAAGTANPIVIKKKRVCAYARVSTDEEEQAHSYEAQVAYYTSYIKSRPDWEFVGIFSDEGISGLSKAKRPGFTKMIDAAMNGDIDLILTKSISRFARNTVDSLVTIRELKQKGVEVYFEKENIFTLGSKGELLITIMSSLAQEESRSISENVTWGKRKSMEKGKVSMSYGLFLGYRRGSNGEPEIVEEEAEIVRRIYQLYLNGMSVRDICRTLTAEQIPTPSKKNCNWAVSTVMSILRNEKYMGDALLQKMYTEDFLTKKCKKNTGELPQYYVTNSHPAIIDKKTFAEVQEEMEQRGGAGSKISSTPCFQRKIVCGDCGHYYGPKLWYSGRYGDVHVWRCAHKYGGKRCETPTLRADDFEKAFVAAMRERQEPIQEFNEATFTALVKRITVTRDDILAVQFKDGVEVRVPTKQEPKRR